MPRLPSEAQHEGGLPTRARCSSVTENTSVCCGGSLPRSQTSVTPQQSLPTSLPRLHRAMLQWLHIKAPGASWDC